MHLFLLLLKCTYRNKLNELKIFMSCLQFCPVLFRRSICPRNLSADYSYYRYFCQPMVPSFTHPSCWLSCTPRFWLSLSLSSSYQPQMPAAPEMVSAGEDDPLTPRHFGAGFAQQTGSCRGPTERLCPGRAGGEVVTPGAGLQHWDTAKSRESSNGSLPSVTGN